MHCSKCGSGRVHPAPLVYRRGHDTAPAAVGADNVDPFDGNYLDVTPEQKNRLSPVVPDMVRRKVPAAAVLAEPPMANSYAGPIVSIAISLFLVFMIFLGAESWGRYLCPLGLIPGILHCALTLRYNLGRHRELMRRWEQSTICVTCGHIANGQENFSS